MTSIRTYTLIFGALMVVSTVQAVIEELELFGDQVLLALLVILGLSVIKAVTVAGWYMHLVEEPRSVTYLALSGVLCVVALTAGAGYSVV